MSHLAASIPPAPPADTIGARIRRSREAAGMSPTKLAAAIGASESLIYKWESDWNAPGAAYLAKLADALGVSVDWLLGRETTEPGQGGGGA